MVRFFVLVAGIDQTSTIGKQLLFSTDAVLRQAYFTKRCIKDTSLTRHQDAMYCLLKITISIFGLENHADHTD